MVQSLYVTDKTLMGLQGSGAWRYDSVRDQVTQVQPPLTDEPYLWFAVSSLESGIWWLPTTSRTPPTFWQDMGGVLHLEASGKGMWTSVNNRPVTRPTSLFWWVPRGNFEEPTLIEPAMQDGDVIGEFPQYPPQGEPVQRMTVERIPNGVIVTVQGGPLVVDIEGGDHE